MAPTKYIDRPVPTISLRNFDSRVDDITKELVDAAENHGFFCIVDHGISRDSIDAIFDQSSRFFSQPDEVKSRVPFSPQHNAGWEKNAQIRPSTGAVDRKESYQMQFGDAMNGNLPFQGLFLAKLTDQRALAGRRDIARFPDTSLRVYASSTGG
jgi:isopenicillin N synthase-like dioxygenase